MRDKIDAFATESEDVPMDDEPPVSDEEFSWLQTRVQLTMLLEGLISRHTLVPVGLGRAATSLTDKLRAWLHAIFLDFGRMECNCNSIWVYAHQNLSATTREIALGSNFILPLPSPPS